jgi:hemolysin activation/secretion protein
MAMRRARWVRATAGLLGVALPVAAAGQPFDRPVDERPEVPEFEEPEKRPRILPELPPLEPSEPRLSDTPQLYVRGYRIVGNTAFDEDELLALITAYAGRAIGSEGLVAVRNILTLHYIDHGYVNSGAVIPDQDAADGIIEIRIVEGRLGEVRIEGAEHYRDRALRWQIERAASTPLDVRALEDRLRVLQQDARIERIEARLRPGDAPGEGVLEVTVVEASPYRAWAEISNQSPPSLGGLRGRFQAEHLNLVGYGDRLRGRFDVSEGLYGGRARYEIPLGPYGTLLRLDAEYTESEIVESPFDVFEFEATYQGYEIGLVQPLLESPNLRVRAGLLAGWRRSETFQDDNPFAFPGSGSDEGRSQLTVLRLLSEATWRGTNQVVAARSLLSWGIDALGATTHTEPDARFVAWLAQLQWAARFGPGIEALFRTDLQLSSGPLFTMEQISMGGYASVRGHRENQIVRDQGVVASFETRFPVWQRGDGRSVLQFAPFVDYGRGWNEKRRTPDPDDLIGIGAGMRFTPGDHLEFEFYWAAALESTPTSGDIQDHGIHVRLAVGWL